MGGGMMNVGADKVQKVKIASVCLDHGLNDPSPRIPYKPIPIESYAKDPAIAELVKLMTRPARPAFGPSRGLAHSKRPELEELANKVGVKHIGGAKDPDFMKETSWSGVDAILLPKSRPKKIRLRNRASRSAIRWQSSRGNSRSAQYLSYFGRRH